MSDLARLIQASAHHLPMIDDKSVQCVVTSPPYFGLRKYDGVQDVEWGSVTYSPMAGLPPITIAGCDSECEHEWVDEKTRTVGNSGGGKASTLTTNNGKGPKHGDKYHDDQKQTITQGAYCQKCGGWRGGLGNEPTIEAYIGHLILCAREWRRVLADDGVMWVNLGDSYASGEIGRHDSVQGRAIDGKRVTSKAKTRQQLRAQTGVPAKNLLLIPARFALAAQADGWVLRSEIIWHKPNPMPESVTDRPTKAHEQIYLFSKQERYFYDADAVREPLKPETISQSEKYTRKNPPKVDESRKDKNTLGYHAPHGGRNLRTVWSIATQPYSAAHFACFPPALVEPMIKAGSRVGDTVLDPFGGSQTTGKVAIKLGRRYIGVDLSEKYLDELAPERLTVQMELTA